MRTARALDFARGGNFIALKAIDDGFYAVKTGDVCVKRRLPRGGHVDTYLASVGSKWLVIGGNVNDAVTPRLVNPGMYIGVAPQQGQMVELKDPRASQLSFAYWHALGLQYSQEFGALL